MPTAVSSCREEMYSGTSPGWYGLASASQSGAQSDPGEAKMRSTPIARSTRRTASAPVGSLLSNIQLGQELAVARVLDTHIGGELVWRHRLRDVHRQRLETLEHHRLLHGADHFPVEFFDCFARRTGGGEEAEMRPAVDALDALLLERRHVRKLWIARRPGDRDHAQLPAPRGVQAHAGIERKLDLPAEEIVQRR